MNKNSKNQNKATSKNYKMSDNAEQNSNNKNSNK